MVWKPPTHCPAGHALVWPNVKRGWVQCDCPKATGGPAGHDYVLCWPCKREIREGGCDRLVNGVPVPDGD
jgi:hypothetical protein